MKKLLERIRVYLFRTPPGGQFKLGDKVSWLGSIGTVIKSPGADGRIQVLLMGHKVVAVFDSKGRFFQEQKRSLFFLERPEFKIVDVVKQEEAKDGK